MMNKVIFIVSFILFAIQLPAQQKQITIQGKVTNSKGEPLELVNISLKQTPTVGTVSDSNGNFKFRIPFKQGAIIVFSMLGYTSQEYLIKNAKSTLLTINASLIAKNEDIQEIIVKESKRNYNNFERIDPNLSGVISNANGGVESIIKTMIGVSSNNELSSQYSVRGGNFDENLVYVNDVEIYRPFLIRSGQQEGLSFINSDMISSINFSAGGFDAKYGDKMSSVLDIRYKDPTKFGASASVSMLGANLHLEDRTKNKKFSYNLGLRYKTNQYLLNTLDEKGEYDPKFIDGQVFLTYHFNDQSTLSFIGNLSSNKYNFVPITRETKFGTYSNARAITIYFDGQEEDKFNTLTGALTYRYRPNSNIDLKFIGSSFYTLERENYDIIGEYLFSELNLDAGINSYGEDKLSLGIGKFHEHARNELVAHVTSFNHKGTIDSDNHLLQWGLKIQHEMIDDEMNQWELRDSAGYSLPHSETEIKFFQSSKTNYEFSSTRLSGYLQETWWFNNSLYLTGGIRMSYWDYNNEFILSPRASIRWVPQGSKSLIFRLASGFYHQPPFYKELKMLSGEINPNVKAQRSFQVLGGNDYLLKIWDRPFKLTTELYYKHFDGLIPYEIENVRIRYLSDQLSDGYATGLDMKINGEFVSGVQSWASLSIMKTEEDIRGDGFGYIPRPTDQRINFSMFFQDYLPGNPSYKMNLTMHYGSRLPFGPPNSSKDQHTLRIPPYRRVDMGLSKVLIDEKSRFRRGSWLNNFRELWIGLDVFNLFGIRNTVSYFWVNDIYNNEWAVPNYLTGRRFNVKVSAKF
ncbi:TonB-dependent receptor [Puteibacter caeruleilacunae]|nr:TonB-dependent receptor [Puteibacter caeruleilacunae]